MLKSLSCPNCGASLEIEDGIDTFFCKYCGHKILLEGLSKHAYDAKVRVKNMEYRERVLEKQQSQERYKIETENKDKKKTVIVSLSMFAAIFIILFTIGAVGEAGEKRQEQELQVIVNQIMVDIEDENFTAAYIKANSLYWDESYSSKGTEKWNSIREATIKQIEAAELKATGVSTNPSNKEDEGLWDSVKGIFE